MPMASSCTSIRNSTVLLLLAAKLQQLIVQWIQARGKEFLPTVTHSPHFRCQPWHTISCLESEDNE